jgi:hypothetical protein
MKGLTGEDSHGFAERHGDHALEEVSARRRCSGPRAVVVVLTAPPGTVSELR